MKNKLLKAVALTLAFGAVAGGLTGCIDATGATSTLENAGYEDVKITGYNFFACGQDDFYHTGFTAKNVKGKTVEGTVCSGLLFKDSTIRYR